MRKTHYPRFFGNFFVGLGKDWDGIEAKQHEAGVSAAENQWAVICRETHFIA